MMSLSVGSDSISWLLTHTALSPDLIFLLLCVPGGDFKSFLFVLAGKGHLKIEAGEELRGVEPFLLTLPPPKLIDDSFQFSVLL